jgi:hypothetical protein
MAQKGQKFEREVCRDLSEWITGERDPVIFWRSAGSGAQATMAHRTGKGSNMDGDIMSLDGQGEWLTNAVTLDSKWYKKWHFDVIFTTRYKDILTYQKYWDTPKEKKYRKDNIIFWWHKLKWEGEKVNKIPMLIVRKNLYDPYLFFPIDMYDTICDLEPSIVFVDQEETTVAVVLWKDFLERADPQEVKEYLRKP